MTISISTEDYIKYIPVTIDGVNFGIRKLNSAETLEVAAMQREMNEGKSDAANVIKQLTDIFFSLYDHPEKAREVLGKLSVDSLADIYAKVMGE